MFALACDLARELEYAVERRVRHDARDQAMLQRVGGADRLAADDHLQRLFGADRARQALRAAGARQQADFYFGQCEQRVLRRDSIVATERQLEPAAHADAVHRCYHRLCRALDVIDHLQQARLAPMPPAY